MKFLSRYNLILYSILLSGCFLFVYGYTFNSGDQAECLPQIYQLHKPSLYPTDFFVQQYHEAFTVRYFFIYLVYGLSLLIPLPILGFSLTLLACVLDIYFFLKITGHFTTDKAAIYFAPLFAFFIFLKFTVGGNYLQDNFLIPGTITVPFALAGLWLFLEKKFIVSCLLLGIGTLLQPLVTLQLFLILWLLQALNTFKDRDWKTLTLGTLAFLIPALFMLAPLFYRQFGLPMAYDKNFYYEILYRFRNHLHYIPSLFPISDYLKFTGLVIAGFLSIHFSEIHQKRVMGNIIALVLVGMLCYWFLFEIVGLKAIGKLQWFKATIWASALASIAVAALLSKYSRKVLAKFNWEKPLKTALVPGIVIVFFALLNSRTLPIEKLQTRYHVGNYKKTDLTLMHEWIADNLTKDAVVLCSPENTSFACEAKRNQAIQYQAIIHEPFYMLPWYERISEVYGINMENADRVDRRKQAAELYTTRNYKGTKYRIDFRIDNVKSCKFVRDLGPALHQEGDYILTIFIPE